MGKTAKKGFQMRKIISAIAIAILATVSTQASTQPNEPMSQKKIKRLDRQLTAPLSRHFKSISEYKRYKNFKATAPRRAYNQRRVGDIDTYHAHFEARWSDDRGYGYRDSDDRYSDDRYRDDWDDGYTKKIIKQHGYKYTKRGWYLAYRFDRAEFNDQYGYHYGYFNKYGFFFDGEFYAYDRYYGYRDRVRGKGVFDGLYYMPANSKLYGFEIPKRKPIKHHRHHRRHRVDHYRADHHKDGIYHAGPITVRWWL